MGDRAVILESQEPLPSPPPPANAQSSLGDPPYPQDAAAPKNVIGILGDTKTYFSGHNIGCLTNKVLFMAHLGPCLYLGGLSCRFEI